MFILAAYENVRYRSESGDYPGKLYVTPGSLIFMAGNDVRLILLYSDVVKISATSGRNQQLTILTRGDEYASEYHNIDLQGCSYDGANYEDLQRICQLIQQNAGTV